MTRRLAVALALAPALASGAAISALEAIGWKLFFDPLLSEPRNTSCSSCHIPDKGFETGVALGEGAYGDRLPRNAPTVVNLADAQYFFWDGRAESLEEQAKGPIENPIEMNLALDEAAARVRAEPAYARAFARAGIPEIRIGEVARALAAFERGLTTGPTLFDEWLRGDRAVFDDAQERGRMIFFTRGQCATCHLGPNLTDGLFHNIGTGSAEDPGRSAISGDDYDLGAFKTPALRNWKGRGPFMHDGRFATLDDVLDFYNEPKEGALGHTELDPLGLDEQDQADVKAFLETLNGAWPDLAPYEAAWQAIL